MKRRLLLAAFAVLLVAPGSARAADPILPLADVQPGMRCTGLSVVRGLEIARFDVEILDVIDRERGDAARLLVRLSGPAIERTGIGPGFSGSPILCTGADGVQRNAGAISEAIGEYGGLTGLATPIEAILAAPAVPPVGARVAGARSLAGPLTIAGVRSQVAAMLTRAARRAGRTLIAVPAATRARFAPQPLVPGASVSVGLTAGDVAIGAVGTVAYADGENVWAFGHSLDGAGRRALFLQDAYIHTVVNNPIAAAEVSTYKLGAPGNDLGTVTGDALTAVAGRLGALPPSYPLRITARDRDTGRIRATVTRIAEEGDIGNPAGVSALGLAGAAAVAEAAAAIVNGAPRRQSGEMCVKITLREVRAPVRFCNHYAVDGGGANALGGALAADMSSAIAILESYRFGTLHPTAIDVGLRVRRGMSQAFLVDATAPRTVRRGRTLRVRLVLRRTGTGARVVRTIRIPIPASTRPGPRTLRLTGTPADEGGDPSEDDAFLSIFFEDEESTEDDAGPETVDEVVDALEDLERYDGVTSRFAGVQRRAYRDPLLRISGATSVEVDVRR